jgi:hypothetical protein
MKKSIIGIFAFLFVFSVASVVQADLSDGLVGYWDLNLNTLDQSSNNNDGVLSGGFFDGTDVPTLPGNTVALFFNGIDEVVTVDDDSTLDLEEEISISFWFKLEGNSLDNDWPRAVSKGQTTVSDGGYGVFIKDISDPNDIGFRFIDQSNVMHEVRDTALASYYDDEWHHVVATYSNSDNLALLYLDDVLIDTTNIIGDVKIRTNDEPLKIGAGVGDADRYFNGGIDEVRVYDRALSAGEVSDLFSGNYELFERSAEITSPDEDSIHVGNVELTAILIDDDTDDNVQWAVREGTCAAGTNTVFGNVDGHNDLYTWDGVSFSSTWDASGATPGMYCFIFNPTESFADAPIRETREFWVADAYIHGGGHILATTSPDQKRKDWLDVSFGGWLADFGELIGDWTIQFHNVETDEFDKTTFHATEFTQLNMFNGNSGTCDDAFNFTAFGTLNGDDGWKVVVRGGDLDTPASQNPDTLRVTLSKSGNPTYDTFGGAFPSESSCVGTARTRIDTGNLVIEQ